MCLAIPGKVVETYQREGLALAQVEFGGVRREVCLEYVPDADQGDYVLVHVGIALSVVDEAEAERTYRLLEAMGGTEELDAAAPGAAPEEPA